MIGEEFDKRRHFGFMLDNAAREIKKAVGRGVIEMGEVPCNLKNAWLVGYIERQSNPVFQKDLEKTFHFPKSTLADMIQCLEKSGYLAKAPVDTDARKKQIVVTEKGKNFSTLAEKEIMAVEDYITRGIPEDQIDLLVEIFEKIQQNAKDYKSYVELKKED